MFDEIFKRWVNTNQLTQNDIIPLLLEWNQEFGNKKATAQDAVAFTQFIQLDWYSLMSYILKMIGIKRGYNWGEVYSKEGKLLTRFWNEKDLHT